MIKPQLLRQALEAALPQLKTNPDLLAMYIDRGTIVHWAGSNLAYRQEYTLNLVVTGWTAHTAALVVPILIWLARHQPELVSGNTPAFTFEADIIDADAVDISIELALSESMQVQPRTDGGFDLIPENNDTALFADAQPLTDPVVLLRQLWWRDERVLPKPPLPVEPAP